VSIPDIFVKNWMPVVGTMEVDSVACDLVRRGGVYMMGVGGLFYILSEVNDPLIKRQTALLALGWTAAKLVVDQWQKSSGRWVRDPILPACTGLFIPAWLYIFVQL
jgi:hypothetical protein